MSNKQIYTLTTVLLGLIVVFTGFPLIGVIIFLSWLIIIPFILGKPD